MKNLKKLLAVMISVAMVLSTFAVVVSAKSFPDVTEDSNYYEAVSILSALQIVEGDDQGNYNPDATLKRSEAAAILIRLTNNEAAAQGSTGYSAFTDVAVDHWAVGYINCAANLGYINGIGDGKFDPDATLKYQEFVKMLVAALGYTPMAENRGGYPTGYLVVGASQGVTDGLQVAGDAEASRGVVAKLGYNALDVPLMEQTGYGAYNEEYTIYDGKNGNAKKTLASDKLDIAKVRATVTKNNRTGLDGRKIDRKKDVAPQVELQIVDTYDIEYDDFEEGYPELAFVGETNADELLAYDTVAYLQVDDNDDINVLAIVPETSKNQSLTIDKDIENVEGIGTGSVVFEYWEDKETDRDTTDVDIASDASIIVNGSYIGKANDPDIKNVVLDANSEDFDAFVKSADIVKFVGPNNDDYNRIFVTKYEYAVVDEVNVEDKEIRVLEGGSISLENLSSSALDLDYTITLDGEDITLEDVEQNDVLNIVYEGNNKDDFDFVDIIITRNPIEGTVTERNVEDNKTKFTIGDAEYEAVNDKDEEISLNDTGVFFISITGKIVDFDTSGTLSGNYAFITKVGLNENGFDEVAQVKLFTKEGRLVTYDMATNFKVNTYDEEGNRDTVNYTSTTTTSETKHPASDFVNEYKKYIGDSETLPSSTDGSIEKRFITFKTDNSDRITEINIAGNDARSSVFNYRKANAGYKEMTGMLGNYEIKDESILFYIPVDKDGRIDENSIELRSFGALTDGKDYEAYIYDVDSAYKFNAAVITDPNMVMSTTNAFAVVEKVSTATVDGEEVTMLYFLQGSERKNLPLSDTNLKFINLNTSKELEGYDEDNLARGDVLEISVNSSDEIYSIAPVYDASEYKMFVEPGLIDEEEDTSYVFGIITRVGSSRMTIANAFGVDSSAAAGAGEYAEVIPARIPEGHTLARYEEQKSSNYLTSMSGVGSLKASNSRGLTAYLAVAKLDDGTATDIMMVVLPRMEVDEAAAFETALKPNCVFSKEINTPTPDPTFEIAFSGDVTTGATLTVTGTDVAEATEKAVTFKVVKSDGSALEVSDVATLKATGVDDLLTAGWTAELDADTLTATLEGIVVGGVATAGDYKVVATFEDDAETTAEVAFTIEAADPAPSAPTEEAETAADATVPAAEITEPAGDITAE